MLGIVKTLSIMAMLMDTTAMSENLANLDQAGRMKLMSEIASMLNANLPIMVDQETQLDSVIGFPNEIRYKHTLVNYASEELDVDHFNRSMQPRLRNSVCTTSETRMFINAGLDVSYAYYSNEGNHIAMITISQAACERM